MFLADADLEADLGIDSVKQTEMLARVAEQYALPALPDDFRLADYTTLGRIADLIGQTERVTPEPQEPAVRQSPRHRRQHRRRRKHRR